MITQTQNPIVDKYIIWDVLNRKWFRPSYPGMHPDAKGKITNQVITEEILFSQSGEMYMRRNTGVKAEVSANIIDCDELEHVSQDVFIPCIYAGFKDSDEKKIYAGHVVRIHPEDDEAYAVEVAYDADSGTWSPHHECSDYTYSLADCKGQLGWRIEIIGHILENPELAEKL